MRKILTALLLLAALRSGAQVTEHSGWAMYLGSFKLSQHAGLHLDMHVRSGDDLRYVKTLMFRPGVSWLINGNQTFSAGFAIQQNNRNLVGAANNYLTDIGAWEHFIQYHRAGTVTGLYRARLEQRFLEQPGGDRVFAQRFRFMVRYVFPVLKQEKAFTTGPFLSTQDELFLNVQHKERVNGSLFDQNRLLGGIGYRVAKQADVEVAYIWQAVNGRAVNTNNHVVQLGIYNRF